MKVGIAGFAGSGKSTVFQWLTGAKPDPAKAQMGQTGNAKIPDPRLDWLSAKFNPKKTTAASMDFLDTPGLMPTERRDNPRRLGILREANGLVVVLNGFGEADPAGQLRRFRDELVFADLEIVTNRIGRLDEQLRKPRPAKLEQELHDLGEEDRKLFMQDLGLTAFVRDDVLRTIFTATGQQVFFTVGEDECRAWPVPKGADAVEGAAQIHTDLARGFVRAEVVSYADFQRVGSMKDAKSQGVYRLEGKTYTVQDGDIMHILSSV